MILWMIFAAMTAAGLILVLWPLLRPKAGTVDARASDLEVYRDQLQEVERDLARGVINAGDAESARREISRRLLAADAAVAAARSTAGGARGGLRRAVAAVTVVAIPLIGLSVYLASGSPDLRSRPLAERLAGPIESRSMPELLARVEAHLRANPDDAEGWRVIAPVYLRMGRFTDAAEAFRQVLRISGKDAAILANYGEALVQAEGGVVTADARRAFDEAASLDPQFAKARFYQGLALLQEGDKQRAVETWRKLLADAPSDAPWRAAVERQVARATGAPVPGGSAPKVSDETVAAAGEMSPEDRQEMIRGMVDGLAKRLDSEGGTVDEWLRLARSQVVLGRKQDAAATLERARAAFKGEVETIARIDAFAAGLQ